MAQSRHHGRATGASPAVTSLHMKCRPTSGRRPSAMANRPVIDPCGIALGGIRARSASRLRLGRTPSVHKRSVRPGLVARARMARRTFAVEPAPRAHSVSRQRLGRLRHRCGEVRVYRYGPTHLKQANFENLTIEPSKTLSPDAYRYRSTCASTTLHTGGTIHGPAERSYLSRNCG